MKCRCVVRERLSGQVKSGLVKSGQVKCSRVPDPVPVPIQVPVPDPVAVPETQLSTNEAAGRRCFQEPEGAGHPAGIMPFDRLEGVWPGRERLSLCNAATGNERSLRRGRRRRVRGGGGRGGWLWAARRSLLAAGCWLLLAFLGISLSCQLAMALAPGPKPLPQPTHHALPACLSLPSATSSTPALPEEHHPRAHMSSLRGRCSGH